jgi:nitric oxide reductase subunit B
VERKGAVDAVVIHQIKTNRYDPAKDTLTLSPLQVSALLENRKFYDNLFLKGKSTGVIRARMIEDREERINLADFFFWTAWCAGTIRPGDTHTYTNNWPHDPSVGNVASGKALVWSAISLVAFGICLGLFVFLFHKYEFNRGSLPFKPEPAQALATASISASQRKTAKYFLVVSVLWFLQVNMGGLMAHYTVHPDTFYGLDFIANFIT